MQPVAKVLAVITRAYQAPDMNPFVERFVGQDVAHPDADLEVGSPTGQRFGHGAAVVDLSLLDVGRHCQRQALGEQRAAGEVRDRTLRRREELAEERNVTANDSGPGVEVHRGVGRFGLHLGRRRGVPRLHEPADVLQLLKDDGLLALE